MATQTVLEVDRPTLPRQASRPQPLLGSRVGSSAAMILGLQKTAGNAAVAQQLARQRPTVGRRSDRAALALQRCGPIPCNCSADERADYAEKHPEEEIDGEASPSETVEAPVQRCGSDGDEEVASNPVGDPPLLYQVAEEEVASHPAGDHEGDWPQEEPVQRAVGPAPIETAVQRAGDPLKIPPGFACPPDLSAGAPTGTPLLFSTGGSAVSPAHTLALTAVLATWLVGGGTDDIVVHGYASTLGEDDKNWTLSCNRAQAVRTELERLGIPPVRIKLLAHGETSEFSASRDQNQRAVVTLRPAGLVPLPLVGGVLTPQDNFTGRSATKFGVGETIDLSFFSLPPTPAAGFGGLEWHLASGTGTLVAVGANGTGTFTAPATAGAVSLELRVAGGALAGRVVSTHAVTIVTPDSVRITEVPGTAPNTSPTAGTIPAGTWGAGFLGNVFVGPKDVSFQGVVFGEGTVASVITGSFLAPLAGAHPVNTFGPGHAGNATTGTPVSPPPDQIAAAIGPITRRFLGKPRCGAGDFLWAIPWEFSVSGGARTAFATANHHMTSTFFCDATIEKGGAGPFTRPI